MHLEITNGDFVILLKTGVVAHLVEHLVRNQKVVGSSPIYSTKKENTNGFSFFVDSYDRLVEDGVEFGVVPVGHATELILIVFLA